MGKFIKIWQIHCKIEYLKLTWKILTEDQSTKKDYMLYGNYKMVDHLFYNQKRWYMIQRRMNNRAFIFEIYIPKSNTLLYCTKRSIETALRTDIKIIQYRSEEVSFSHKQLYSVRVQRSMAYSYVWSVLQGRTKNFWVKFGFSRSGLDST